jgi:hypothetical protein
MVRAHQNKSMKHLSAFNCLRILLLATLNTVLPLPAIPFLQNASTAIGSGIETSQANALSYSAVTFSINPQVLHFAAVGGDLDSVLGEGMKIIMKVGFLLGTVMIMYSGWQLSRGNQSDSLAGIAGGLILALAATIMDKFFTTAGLESISF